MAHPLRRLRLSFPAARPGVAMNGAVVAIVGAFFIIGITVGIIAVVAMSALRADRRGDPGDPPEYGTRRLGEQPPDAGWTIPFPMTTPAGRGAATTTSAADSPVRPEEATSRPRAAASLAGPWVNTLTGRILTTTSPGGWTMEATSIQSPAGLMPAPFSCRPLTGQAQNLCLSWATTWPRSVIQRPDLWVGCSRSLKVRTT